VVPVNGIAMGAHLGFELFRQIELPWFVSVADVVPKGGAVEAMTQIFTSAGVSTVSACGRYPCG
jgi:hypothetical protein